MDLGPSELLLILLVATLLFGAKKLPELARGAGQALRVFKEETRGLGASGQEAPAPAAGSVVAPAPATEDRPER